MIELFVAFGAGLISFLSPCVLPLIPGYISFISGSSLNELIEKKKVNPVPLVLFSLGFSFVFIIFGAAASFLGQLLLENSRLLRVIAGLITPLNGEITWRKIPKRGGIGYIPQRLGLVRHASVFHNVDLGARAGSIPSWNFFLTFSITIRSIFFTILNIFALK